MHFKKEFGSKHCIARHNAPSDHTPPWKDMAFDPPIGSDELSDRLKTAFPEGQTLRQRKYLAAIAFLQAELQQIETEDAALLGPSTPSSFHNTKSLSTRTRHHSHDLLNESQRQSPASYNSPSSAQSASSPSLVDRGRSDADQDPVADARRPSTPNARGATFVFNSVNGRTVKPKTKRKMTQQERRAYKETRIRGACVKCRKTKGKCTHNDDLKAGHLDYNHALPIAEGKNTVEGSPECANLHLSLSEGLSVRNDQSTKSRQPQSSSEPQPTFEDQQVDQFGQRASFVLPSVSDGLWKAGAAPAENSHKNRRQGLNPLDTYTWRITSGELPPHSSCD
ncbi:hypothetical protein K491DRAFT_102998 [Lophiostoma macrostomum CBS 122681]|uniref:Uncharacterized protein n=1 Tax=Lophiostoma macrostomum CBS 122681 TaxID=1314788 RepID=A0A6A6SVQ4_9PLEO|nr:hypothetical protein K491DRAFT_102998 [Lophiostoma macrostomum CBS 122681]